MECGHDGHSPDLTVEFDGNSWEFSTTVEKLVEKPRNHHDWREKPAVFRGFYTGEGRVTAIKRALQRALSDKATIPLARRGAKVANLPF